MAKDSTVVITGGVTKYSDPFSMPAKSRITGFGRRTAGSDTLTAQLQGGFSKTAGALADDKQWVAIGTGLSLTGDQLTQISTSIDAIYSYYRWKVTSSGAGTAYLVVTGSS